MNIDQIVADLQTGYGFMNSSGRNTINNTHNVHHHFKKVRNQHDNFFMDKLDSGNRRKSQPFQSRNYQD